MARRVEAPPANPLLIFDGNCGFCRRWIARWKSLTGDRVDYEPSQSAGARYPEIPEEEFRRSVQLVLPTGEVFDGAQAVFRSLAQTPSGGAWLTAYEKLPGFGATAELLYRFIAGHRQAASRVTTLLWGEDVSAPTYRLANGLFLRLVGFCYLAAFLSLWFQVDGLIGSRGILPAVNLLQAAREQLGPRPWTLLPTLFWIDGSDGFLHFLCGGGALAALLVFLGLVPAAALILCWAFYLSLCVAGQDFLAFQWDQLLLETGFLAIFLAPWRLRVGRAIEGSRLTRALLCWLLFRLMFSSGIVKLESGDPNWRNLTALTYHYWTQPLPPWTAWFASGSPLWFLKASCLAMFAVELLAPFLIFTPRRLRLLGCAAMAGLEALIAATGNYAFFNLLTIALCVLLIDDASFPRALRGPAPEAPGARGHWPRGLLSAVAAVVFVVSGVLFAGTLRLSVPWPRFVVATARAVLPFRSVNNYGLFAVMTTARPEIILEGSDDGSIWKAYEFPFKPGDVHRRPAFVAPHQPRLDWQMWFAALGSYSEQPWFLPFCARLLEGSPPVTRLLAVDPFPKSPPRYLRAVVYEYRFTDSRERRAAGAWWKREEKGLYLPVLSREMLQRPAS